MMPQLIENNTFTQNCVARALYDNNAESPDELSFQKGDVLTVLEQNTSGLEGWWLCSLRGRQGICPGNRLRLLAGVYDIGQKVVGDNWNSPTELNSSQPGKRRSWHAQPNKIMPQKAGDVYMYDSSASNKSQTDYKYDVPPNGAPVLDISQFHSHSHNNSSSRPESSGSSGYGCVESYEHPSKVHSVDATTAGRYDTPRWPPQRCRNNSDSYDVPRPVTNSSIGSISPSSSISSLATSATDSVSSSNRSSIAPDYDVPRPSRPVPFVQLHLQKLEEGRTEVTELVQPRALPLELNSAIENLERLEGEITTAISKLLSYADPGWREKDKLDPKLMDIKLAALRLRSSLNDLSEFSEGVLGNALNAADKGLPQKVRPLIKTLIETNNTVQDSCKELDCYDWSIDILAKSKESPSFGESNYTLDGLDQLIACARSLTEDVRQFASFVQGNSILLFKKTSTGQNDNKAQLINTGEYLNLDSQNNVKKDHDDASEILRDEIQKSYNTSVHESECSGNYTNGGKIVTETSLDYTDKQVLRFYAVQCDSYTLHLTHAIGSFIKTVEHNQPPKVFLAHGKFVILCAHRLVHIGDTVSRNVSYGEVSAKVLAITNSLAETLAATVHKIKKAALQFPSSVAVQEMVDSVFDMSDIANGLRLYVNYSSKI